VPVVYHQAWKRRLDQPHSPCGWATDVAAGPARRATKKILANIMSVFPLAERLMASRTGRQAPHRCPASPEFLIDALDGAANGSPLSRVYA
jgi:hypothetical protein